MSVDMLTDWRTLMEATLIPPAERLGFGEPADDDAWVVTVASRDAADRATVEEAREARF